MQSLSEHARLILERMEPDLRYEPKELRAFAPDTTIEGLRDIMHELWINRLVERVGYSGWRRHRSAAPHLPHPASGEIQEVKPDELFDHAAFADFFK
jgi:hypothetical protein